MNSLPTTPLTAHGQPNTGNQTFISYIDGVPHQTVLKDGLLSTRDLRIPGDNRLWRVIKGAQAITVTHADRRPEPLHAADWLTMLDGLFNAYPELERVEVLHAETVPQDLSNTGVLLPAATHTWQAGRDILWQQARLWRPDGAQPPQALRYVMTDQKRHPLRPLKPRGILYQRYIPWLDKTLSFRRAEIDIDLARINAWMNEPAVAQVWQESGDQKKHRQYLASIESDPHIYSMIASLDDIPFGYFEVYWAKEDRIAPFYDVDDYDRGWHVLIGEPNYRGKAHATAWLTSISHYLFLDDPRTQRIMGEPRADHTQQIRNLDKSGYAKVKEFALPHKQALLVMLLRERYFSDALWWPRSDTAQT